MSIYRKELGLTKEVISRECDISKSTFIQFEKQIVDILRNNEHQYINSQVAILNIFARNNIQNEFKDFKKYKGKYIKGNTFP
jgi:DNA-binding XRE family transcriptional regulator